MDSCMYGSPLHSGAAGQADRVGGLWPELPNSPVTNGRYIQGILLARPHKQKCFQSLLKSYQFGGGTRSRRRPRKKNKEKRQLCLIT